MLSWQVGQTVACMGSGAFAEYVTAKAGSCYPIREASAEACAVLISGLTAAAALEVQLAAPSDLVQTSWRRLHTLAHRSETQCCDLQVPEP